MGNGVGPTNESLFERYVTMAKRNLHTPVKQRDYGKDWAETQKQMKSDFVSLKNDGDKVLLAFAGEPWTREEKGVGGQMQIRAYLPVITTSGLQAWGVGKRTLQLVHTLWPQSLGVTYVVTRHGVANDTTTTYEIIQTRSPDRKILKILSTLVARELTGLRSRVMQSTPSKDDDIPI